MFLRGHALEGLALLVPDVGDVENQVRLPVALLGLVRLEEVDRRRAERPVRVVAVGLGHDARFLGEIASRGWS